MRNEIGSLVTKSRAKSGLTQDQFGRKYNVSGPAIFKFEKGYVKPSLDLWLQIAKDANISEQAAVLLWVKSKLPKKYQSFIDVDAPPSKESTSKSSKSKSGKKRDYSDPEAARKQILADRTAPKGLKRLLRDDDLWSLYKPQSHELQVLEEVFGQLGEGSKSSYREALRLVREFSGS